MYETFFGLKRRPFPAIPDAESYFSVELMADARRAVERALRRGDGLSLVFGPSGTGKTLLLRLLRKALESEFTVLHLANGHLETPRALFQQLLFDLKLPFSGGDEVDHRLQLLDAASREDSAGIVLLVDEAQFLSIPVLEEIRLLTDSGDSWSPLFRAVLAGTVDFDEKLTHPKLDAFNQRVACRSYLDAFSHEETCRYIEWQSNFSQKAQANATETTADPATGLADFIENSGLPLAHRVDSPHVHRAEPIFTDAARHQIHQLTGGVPRRINQLCDVAMQLAAERVLQRVDDTLVHSAWARFQQFDEDAVSADTGSASANDSDAGKESIDEIVARKKATFRPVELGNSVQFGTLEPETPATLGTYEEAGASCAMSPDSDDALEFAAELDNALLFSMADPVPTDEVPPPFEKTATIEKTVEKTVEPEPASEQKASEILLLTFEPLIVDDMEEPLVDAEMLEQYGAEILDGRPPFVRKEPEYVYQTTEDIPGIGLIPCSLSGTELNVTGLYHPGTEAGRTISLCWHQPAGQGDCGFGTAYRVFMARDVSACHETLHHDEKGTDNSAVEALPLMPLAVKAGEPPVESIASPTVTQIVCVVQGCEVRGCEVEGEEHGNYEHQAKHTAFDEPFDEISTVLRDVVALEQLFASTTTRSGVGHAIPATRPGMSNGPIWNEAGFQSQIDSVLQRIAQAAEKIEQAADISEEAGLHVRRAADFVETEVKSALPTYVDFFRELSDFQKTITAELASHQEMSQISETLRNLQNRENAAPNDSSANCTGSARSAELLPFPRRPSFGPAVIAVEKKQPAPHLPQKTDPTLAVEDAAKEEQTIDVRTLFQ